jgi:hypothetical protein
MGVSWLAWGSPPLVVSARFAVVNPGAKAVGVRSGRFVVLCGFHAVAWLLALNVTFLLTLIGQIS